MTSSSRKAAAARFAALLTKWLANERCFYIVVALLGLQALWFVFSARYPMAFDEDFHFGLIQLHARQWLPFFTSQPPHSAQFGAIARDPSYLYHFLMSIPYRLLTLVSHNSAFQIISLRLINVALSLYSLVLARRLMFRMGASRALAHTSLFLLVLVPIVPFLAAHINYDNLFIPLTLWSLLATFKWIDELNEGRVSFVRSIVLLSIFCLASLVKYAFLPIAATLGGVMLWEFARRRAEWPDLRHNFRQALGAVPRWQIVVSILLLVVSVGLFSERYLINAQRYHSPNPDCGQVLTVPDCLSYGPWARDYTLKQNKPVELHVSKLAYLWQWPFGIWFRSFFAISDTYDTQPPLPIVGGAAIAVAGVGIVMFIRYGRRLLTGNTPRKVVMLAFTFYTIALFAQTFQAYMATGEPVAINGRYLLPFLPAIIVLAGLAYRELWRHQPLSKAFVTLAVTLLFLQGGGMLTFMMRSTDTWYWQNDTVISVNHTLREALKPLFIDAGHY